MIDSSFPVLDKKDALLKAIECKSQIVLSAPTGSGKSTIVPKVIVESGLVQGLVLVVQPRQLATKLLARRVAYLLGEPLGKTVGYQVRFDRCDGPETKILFITQGILIRMLSHGDPLQGIGAVVLDEFHERSLDADVSLGLIQEIQKVRIDLKLLVMSATLDQESLLSFLRDPVLIEATGSMYPVALHFAGRAPMDRGKKVAVWDHAVSALQRFADKIPEEGSILIFMPGVFEIHRTIRVLEDKGWGRYYELCPLYSSLSAQKQDHAVSSSGLKRKMIVSTNVAETSITIPEVTAVVDSGLVKLASFDSGRGMNTLLTERVSQASAKQRMGRAGRVREGICIRLWSEKDQESLPSFTLPEIGRVELSSTVLSLKSLNYVDVLSFTWFEKPSVISIQKSEALLKDLGALDSKGIITPMGLKMRLLPLHPRLSRMLLDAVDLGCCEMVSFFCALIQERDFFLSTTDKKMERSRQDIYGSSDSDFMARFLVFLAVKSRNFDVSYCNFLGVHRNTCVQIKRIQEQILSIVRIKEFRDAESDEDLFIQCLLASFSDYLAVRFNRGTLRFAMNDGKFAELRPQSLARKSEIIISCDRMELDQPKGRGVSVVLGMAIPIDRSALKKQFSNDWHQKVDVVYRQKEKRVVTVRRSYFRNWLLDEKEELGLCSETAAGILALEVMEGRLKIKCMDERVDQFRNRVAFIASKMPELQIEKISEEDYIAILTMAFEGCTSYKEIKKLEIFDSFESWLSKDQIRALDYYLPTYLKLSSRSKPFEICYQENCARISAKVQELYDVHVSELSILEGQYELVIDVLAPNYRTIQTTNKLSEFWETSYPQIKKDLKGRYPKHEWR